MSTFARYQGGFGGGGGGGGSGNVVGPASSTTNDIATFADTTGKLLQDSGLSISGTAPIVVTPSATGALTLRGFNNGAGVGQVINVTGGTGTTNGGAVNIAGGAGSSGTGGAAAVSGGNGTTIGGNTTVTSGTTTSTTQGSGTVLVTTGTNSTAASSLPGLLTVRGGTSTITGSNGGTVVVQGGNTNTTSSGGVLNLRGGTSTSGTAGSTKILFGSTTNGLPAITVDGFGNILMGQGTTFATNSTNGFLTLTAMQAPPTGTPVNATSVIVPMVYDIVDNALYMYNANSSTWVLPQNISPELPNTANGATTITFGTSPSQQVSLQGNSTITLAGMVSGGAYVLNVTQNATPFTCTFPGVKWPGGTPPVITAVSGATDILNFYVDGSGNIYGTFAQAFA